MGAEHRRTYSGEKDGNFFTVSPPGIYPKLAALGYEQMNLFKLSFAQLFGIALNKIFDFLLALLSPFTIFALP